MSDRWRDELTKLRRAELPPGLWDRATDGPRMAPLPTRDPSRMTTIGVAVVVFVLAMGLAWMAFSRSTARVPLGGPDVVTVPARGETAPVFTTDGRPVFVVHHEDGTVSVVDAISTHHPWGFDDLLGWCAPTRQLVEWAHGTHFDERGRWVTGPAAGDLTTYTYDVVATSDGAPAQIRIRDVVQTEVPEDGQSGEGNYDYCPEGTLLAHTYDRSGTYASPTDAVAAAPDGYVAVLGTLLVRTPALGAEPDDPWIRLCGEVVEVECRDGVTVINIDGLGLLTGVLEATPGTAYENEQVWLTRVRDGVLVGLGIIPPDQVA